MLPDPVRAAWEASGRPVTVEPSVTGQCSRCGHSRPGVPHRQAVSGNFGDLDKLRWRHSGVLCPACTWALTRKELRTRAHVITQSSVTEATAADLLAVLSAPVSRDCLVVVPLSGHKHIVPWAPWGVVATDHEQVRWGAGDAARLPVLAWLRALGFGEAALREAAPRWAILRKLAPPERAEVMSAWPALLPWRQRPSCLEVACRATRKPKEETSPDAP